LSKWKWKAVAERQICSL